MFFKNFFRKKSVSDLNVLIFLSDQLVKEMEEYFDEVDEENDTEYKQPINLIELIIFAGALNSACYLIFRKPRKEVLSAVGLKPARGGRFKPSQFYYEFSLPLSPCALQVLLRSR